MATTHHLRRLELYAKLDGLVRIQAELQGRPAELGQVRRRIDETLDQIRGLTRPLGTGHDAPTEEVEK